MDTKSYHGPTLLSEAMEKYQIDLGLLIAETALWAHPEVHKLLQSNKNLSGAFYPNVRRAKKSQKEARGGTFGGIIFDDNTYANTAIKKAIGVSKNNIKDFACCHIWRDTCYSEECHTVIANLVLLPASLASLTDHNKQIEDILKYRSYVLYKWLPKGVQRPKKPKNYPSYWRTPFEFTEKIKNAISKRKLR
jgi:hypothetical protein